LSRVLIEAKVSCTRWSRRFDADFDGDQMAVHVPLSLELASKRAC
jgi:DNA-directed RNA polymerase beta' subunit